ncbi:hypothetical protein CCAX7_21860 [Capsulimonas corticalis]|uniref:Uncharacterized protein n=1 Tax=Capsulimonas corticalis TaxID=2219043 RepID=A0A402D235_9BACT|nr:hypothetical protein [Capsulimonas corticalis]BDI30135.1 hypothetical protein CCAX7_21860 [Capsulimonas corticalis]
MLDLTETPVTETERLILAQLVRHRHSAWALRDVLPDVPVDEAYLHLAETLDNLLHRDAIFAMDIRGGGARRYCPARLELESAADCDAPHLIVGLTARGGELWEADAKPDWSQLITVTPDYETFDKRWHVCAADAPTIDRHLQNSGLDDSHFLGDPKHDTVDSWQVTYWKTLPQAHRRRFMLTCRGKEYIRDLRNTRELL